MALSEVHSFVYHGLHIIGVFISFSHSGHAVVHSMTGIISGVGHGLGRCLVPIYRSSCQTLDVHREWLVFGVMSKVARYEETRQCVL
jgi:hypothetical protein